MDPALRALRRRGIQLRVRLRRLRLAQRRKLLTPLRSFLAVRFDNVHFEVYKQDPSPG